MMATTAPKTACGFQRTDSSGTHEEIGGPQLIVCPLTRSVPRTIAVPPHSHLHTHISAEFFPCDAVGSMAVSLPNCLFVKSLNLPIENTRRNRRFVVQGKEFTLTELCRIYGQPRSTVESRLKKGMDIKTALKNGRNKMDRTQNCLSTLRRP